MRGFVLGVIVAVGVMVASLLWATTWAVWQANHHALPAQQHQRR